MSLFNNELFDKSKLTNPKIYDTPYECVIANPDTQLFLCIGDSLTAVGSGYAQIIQDNLRALGYNSIVVKREAESGMRIGDILNMYIDTYLSRNPSCNVFTILLGTNDTKTTANWLELWSSKFFYYQLIKYIQNRVPDAVIRICQIPWISPSTTDGTFLPAATWEVNKDRINQMIRSLARHFGMPEAPDLYAVTKGNTDWYLPDGLHFDVKGYRNLAPVFTNLIKQKPNYTADENFLVGKTYTVSGGVNSVSFKDDGYKLTAGKFAESTKNPRYDNQLGFSMEQNGGTGATINVDVVFSFGEEITINDMGFFTGASGFNYCPDSITIYKYDGTTYTQEAVLNKASEGNTNFIGLAWFNMYTPNSPFKTKGLKITFTKTFNSSTTPSADWLFVGEITATRLNNYSI